MRISVFITTIISVASKTFKSAHVLKCVIVYKATQKNNYELVSKAKIELHLFQQYFTPHTPHLNKARVKPPFVQTSAHASCAQQFLSVNVSNRAAQCAVVTRYSPQATTKFACLVLVPFEHEPSRSECR